MRTSCWKSDDSDRQILGPTRQIRTEGISAKLRASRQASKRVVDEIRRDVKTMNRVPFYDLHAVNVRIEEPILAAQARVTRSAQFLRGKETASFEQAFASFVGASRCIGVASGLDALSLTLEGWKSLGRIQAGDEVVIPANTFIASALATTRANLAIRLADVSADTFNLTPETTLAAISKRTRVVMVVHLYGQVSDIEKIRAICEDRNLLLLEDAAQAHGALHNGKHAGTLGDAAAFSFYPSKNLGALGDAGCMVTDDGPLADRVSVLGNYGSLIKYEHDYLGTNSRLDEMQAAVLKIKLKLLDADNERRRAIAWRYNREISHHLVRLPMWPRDPASHVWHLYVVRSRLRQSLATYLGNLGIEVLIHYPSAIHRQRPYLKLAIGSVDLSTCNELQDTVLSLPISPVMLDVDVSRVIDAVNSWPANA